MEKAHQDAEWALTIILSAGQVKLDRHPASGDSSSRSGLLRLAVVLGQDGEKADLMHSAVQCSEVPDGENQHHPDRRASKAAATKRKDTDLPLCTFCITHTRSGYSP
jgi:hypothetical protein